MKILKKSN